MLVCLSRLRRISWVTGKGVSSSAPKRCLLVEKLSLTGMHAARTCLTEQTHFTTVHLAHNDQQPTIGKDVQHEDDATTLFKAVI